MASDENMSKSGIDDGSLTVAKVRAPSTPFDSDTNPLSNFSFKGSNEIVTVKNVEEIVKAVKDSFSRFIETQRNYAARESSSSDNSSSSKNNDENYRKSEQFPSSSESENGGESSKNKNELTEAVNSDIIKAASGENSLSQNSEVLNSIDIFKDETNSRLDSFYDDFSEKLLNSDENDNKENNQEVIEDNSKDFENAKNKINNDFSSFVDYMISSHEEMENNINSMFDFAKKMSENENVTEESLQDEIISDLKEDTSEHVKTDFFEVDKGILGLDEKTSSKDDFISDFDSLFQDIDESIKNFSQYKENLSEDSISAKDTAYDANEDVVHSIYDTVNEIVENSKTLQIGIDEVTTMLSGMTSGGFAESIVESMIQGSMIQMIADETVDGISSYIVEDVKEQIIDSFTELKGMKENGDEYDDEFFNGKGPDDFENEDFGDDSITDSLEDNEQDDFEFEDEIETEESEGENSDGSVVSENDGNLKNGFFNSIKDYIHGMFEWFENRWGNAKENGENETEESEVETEMVDEEDIEKFAEDFESDESETDVEDLYEHPHYEETENDELNIQDKEKGEFENEEFDFDSEFSKFFDILNEFENIANESVDKFKFTGENSFTDVEEKSFFNLYTPSNENYEENDENSFLPSYNGKEEVGDFTSSNSEDIDRVIDTIKNSNMEIVDSINNLGYDIDNSREEIVKEINGIKINKSNDGIGFVQTMNNNITVENQSDSFEVDRIR